MQRKITACLMAMAFLVSSGLPAVYAGGYKGGKDAGMAWKKKVSLQDKICMKAHFLKENQDEIGLSDAQVKEIMNLKRRSQKDVIAKDAEIEALTLDIWAILYERPIDVEGAKKLVEHKYAVKQAKSLHLVQSLSDMMNVLTDEQYAAMKAVWKKQKKMCRR